MTVYHARIRTERMDLIPATIAMLRCDIADHRNLQDLLGAVVPKTWPPPLVDQETLDQFIGFLREGSDPNFCLWYWITRNTESEKRILVGSGGTGSFPDDPHSVICGYSVLDAFQKNGYATEAVRHLIQHVFADPSILRIYATTSHELVPSIRVLEKTGFVADREVFDGQGMNEGTLRFVRFRL